MLKNVHFLVKCGNTETILHYDENFVLQNKHGRERSIPCEEIEIIVLYGNRFMGRVEMLAFESIKDMKLFAEDFPFINVHVDERASGGVGLIVAAYLDKSLRGKGIFKTIVKNIPSLTEELDLREMTQIYANSISLDKNKKYLSGVLDDIIAKIAKERKKISRPMNPALKRHFKELGLKC